MRLTIASGDTGGLYPSGKNYRGTISGSHSCLVLFSIPWWVIEGALAGSNATYFQRTAARSVRVPYATGIEYSSTLCCGSGLAEQQPTAESFDKRSLRRCGSCSSRLGKRRRAQCARSTSTHRAARRSRKALTMTDTELRLIAALASIGLSSTPKTGYSTPAATGTPSAL